MLGRSGFRWRAFEGIRPMRRNVRGRSARDRAEQRRCGVRAGLERLRHSVRAGLERLRHSVRAGLERLRHRVRTGLEPLMRSVRDNWVGLRCNALVSVARLRRRLRNGSRRLIVCAAVQCTSHGEILRGRCASAARGQS